MTDIQRKFDPQTRKLIPQTPSVAGGVRRDSNSLILHIAQPDAFKAKILAGIQLTQLAFDVQTQEHKSQCFSASTTPTWDGFTFNVPYEVMSKVRTNKLGYQLLFINKDAAEDESIQSQIDYLMVMNALDVSVALDPSLTAYVAKLNESAIVVPVTYADDIITFQTAAGAKTAVDLDIAGRISTATTAVETGTAKTYATKTELSDGLAELEAKIVSQGQHYDVSIVIPYGSWKQTSTGQTQDVANPAFKSTMSAIVGEDLESSQVCGQYGIRATAINNGSITVVATTKPNINIKLFIILQEI